VLNLFRDFENDIAGIIATGDLSFTGLSALRNAVSNRVNELEISLFGAITEGRRRATALGEEMVREAFSLIPGTGGIGLGIFGVSDELISVADQFSADLIAASQGGLMSDVLKRVNSTLNRGVLGTMTTGEVIRQLSGFLGKGDTFSFAAERIARTEILRMFSMASQASMMSAKDSIPDLMKAWIWSRISRVDHARAEDEFGEDNPIPVDQPFLVAGEELMFPRDPNGSAWNTIHCGCLHVPVIPDLARLMAA